MSSRQEAGTGPSQWLSGARSRRTFLAQVPCVASSLMGCASYRMGPQSLYRTDLRTVSVPVIRSDSFRPDLGVRLTEIVQKRIEERTPYRIANQATADSTLTCRLTTDSKQVISETGTDEPRLLQTFFTVEVQWTDRRGQLLMENRFLPPSEVAFYFAQNAHLVPESGQSIATQHQRAMERLADHIVDQMEARW